MSVAVKTYLILDYGEPEIRRFAIDADASTNFEYLLEKIRNVYPSLKRADFKLYWKDGDNELITFSSDDELIEALTHVKGEFFRVYVKAKPSDEKSSENKVHAHVTCDGCEGPVVGSRFKCMVCPDYDLCSTCEAKGGHAQHNMMRIRSPGGPPPFPWFMPWMNGRPMGGRGGFGGGRRGGHPRGPPGFRRGRGGCPPRWGGPFGCPPPPPPPPGNAWEAAAEGQAKSGEETNENGAFFHHFGQALHSFLGPFGVDVHTYVDSEQGDPGQCGQHAENSTPGSAPEAPSDSKDGEGETKKDTNDDQPMEEASSPMSDHTYIVVNDGSLTKEDKSLADAIAQMKSMGFDDDGGWLTQLLKAKNFDINKVLDAIQHPQKKQ